MNEQNRTDIKVIFALTMLHFAGDFYVSFVNLLLPVFVEKFGLSLAQVGLIAGIMRMLAFVVQPGVGYFADRYRSRIFILGGPLLSIVFIALVGWAPSFPVLLLFVAIGSIGAAMFHPSIAGMIAGYAGRHLGLSLSIFNMGGTLAFGLGPLFIAYIVGRWGLEVSPWTAIPGLAVMVLLFKVVPAPLGEGLRGEGFLHAVRAAVGEMWKSVVLIWVVMVLRAFVTQSFLAFIPVLYAREGHTLISIGFVLSIFTVAGTVSGVVAGHLSDRIGYKPIYYVSFILATPSLLLMLFLNGIWVYVSSILAGFFMFATLPLGLVMAQKLAPRGKSMVSSLMMGLAVGTGGMITPFVGSLADLFSIRTVLYGLAFVPFASIVIVYFFPEKKLREQSLVG
ncbi:MAG: MFS transporter [Proteobacteria bacterium]|nr:MFS transporter [Pseudomonadota bacterium]MBU2234170.1 MFS transporter [Pseudomonadota bacterium]